MAQLGFERDDSVPVTEENGLLPYAWAGGINHAQFSNIDLNGDGMMDLVVFDKTGDKLITFLMNEQGQLSLAPKYRHMFTNQHSDRVGLHDWVLLRDYNCDGKNDIITYSNGGMAVYRNDGNSDTLIFTLMTAELNSDYLPNSPLGNLNIYVSPTDLPALMDVDSDGDLDIVTFSLTGFSAEYHRNTSMELFGHCDSLIYVLDNACWGNFSEDAASVQVVLNQPCDDGPGMPMPSTEDASRNGPRHSGFTLLGFDADGDGDKDLLVSNVSFNNVNLLTNGGSASLADMTSQDVNFPVNNGNSSPIEIYTFPAPFLADVTNDGKDDLILTGYQEGNANNFQGTWLYTNTGTATTPLFTFTKRTFLHDGMIDLGTSAYPVFFDYDNDGLKDMLVGNLGYFISTATYSAQLAYYRNTGTAQAPQFTLVNRDLLSLSSMDLKNVAPTFGDIDGDGDDDMIIGTQTGIVHLFTNMAGAGNPCNFVLTQVGYQGINIIGQNATPQLFDVNSDGLLDLVIGEMAGNLNYFRNEGTTSTPQFVLADTQFGGVDMKAPSMSFGYSAPFLFHNGEEAILMVGGETGRIAVYDGLTDILTGPALLEGTVGDGVALSTDNTTTPFHFVPSSGSSFKSGRHQFLIKASELQSQGIVQSALQKVAIDVFGAQGLTVSQITMRMAQTSLSELNEFQSGLTQFSTLSVTSLTDGAIQFGTNSPFTWDGVSNLIIEICWYNTGISQSIDLQVRYTETAFSSHAYASANNNNGCNISQLGNNNKRPNMRFTAKPIFNLVGNFPVYEGERSVPFGADLNNDGLVDLAIGNLAGGMAFYRGSEGGFNIGINEQATMSSSTIGLYPNPSNGTFNVVASPEIAGVVTLNVIDLQGRSLWTSTVSGLNHTTLSPLLPAGLYLLEISSSQSRTMHRFVVNK